MKKLILLLLCMVITMLVGATSGLLTIEGINEWYPFLLKPFFNPPNYIFGPVWTVLYLVMGISLFLIWDSDATKFRTRALAVFSAQLLLNFLWSFLFFYLRSPLLALIDIMLLWWLISTMISLFVKINKTAGYIQIPYLLWVSFATVLNASIWYLNK
ncbi:MAG: tryptophan-rich sensory protein [Saprospiraceae bacterium]|nr:tryptophan-rich sensory protein [Candidatus Vicinibacter affinis]MBP6173763.1 tryptophan-rich sensory protein [Saprospiraceae bacterium]MBK6571427.1 tryptophan-rich sensory protein [Candidatus Vicinibacter affinis]MBK6823363.1 tryptophan-rich sensory protein [Candidatus Vicinibacter affinis]MBK7695376.1 tryptophan-rich sensory protein [Candidatus Vicinibacter affinis]